MYENITIPGVLIEVGFISNYSDRKKIESFFENIKNAKKEN